MLFSVKNTFYFFKTYLYLYTKQELIINYLTAFTFTCDIIHILNLLVKNEICFIHQFLFVINIILLDG